MLASSNISLNLPGAEIVLPCRWDDSFAGLQCWTLAGEDASAGHDTPTGAAPGRVRSDVVESYILNRDSKVLAP